MLERKLNKKLVSFEPACGEVLLVLQPIFHADVQIALLFTEGEVFPTVH